ncbi:MAG: MMPL family transporter [bacterium]
MSGKNKTWARLLAHGGILLFILAAGGWSVAHLNFQTELLPLFPQHLPSVQTLAYAQERFSSQREVWAVFQPRSEEERRQAETGLTRAAGRFQKMPGVASAEISSGFTAALGKTAAWLVAVQSPERFDAICRALSPEEARKRLGETVSLLGGALDADELARLRIDPLRLSDFFEGNPFGKFSAATGNAQPLALKIEAVAPLQDFEACQKFVGATRKILDQEISEAGLRSRILLTGQPAFTAEISSAMRRDMILMITVAVVLASLVFWIFYRSLVPLLWILALQVLNILGGFIAAQFFFGSLNVLSVAFAAILMGVSMDYCILVYHHFAQGEGLRSEAWRPLRRGIWFSAVTTAASFGILYFSIFPGLRQLAVLIGAGLLVGAWGATAILPLALSRRRLQIPAWLGRVSERAAEGLQKRGRFWKTGCIAFLILCATAAPFVRHYPFYAADARRLQPTQLEAYRGQALLRGSHEPPSLPLLSSENAARNRVKWTPRSAAELEQIFQQAGLDASWAKPTLEVLSELNQWSAGGRDLEMFAASANVWPQLQRELGDAAARDFKRLSLWMFLAVLGLSFAALRSVRLTVLSMCALGGGLLLLLALVYANRVSMTIVSLLCVPLLIGLIIDYGLHMLLELEHHKGDLRAVFRQLAAPMSLTGLTSLIGFSAPFVSSQPVLQNFGFVMDLGVIASLAVGLMMLPVWYGGGARRPHYSAAFYRAGWFAAAESAARWIPRRWLRGLAKLAGFFYAWTHPAKVAVVRRNLALTSPPSVSFREACRVYQNFGANLADYFYVSSRPRKQAAQIISERMGYDHLKKTHEAGRGALLVTVHLGLFELGGLLMQEFGFPTAALTFPEPSRELTQWRAAYRRRWGVETIEVGEDEFAFFEILRQLRQGKFIAAPLDRPGDFQSVEVTFPGGRVRFASGVLLIALAAQCPVIPSTIVAKADGSYRIEAHPPLELKPRGSREETLHFYAQKIADVILPTLCQYRTQWYQFVSLS